MKHLLKDWTRQPLRTAPLGVGPEAEGDPSETPPPPVGGEMLHPQSQVQ